MKKTLLALCCVAALISCKKTAGPEGPQGATGPQGPAGNSNAGTGIITGNVKQYDQYAVQYTIGLNTTTVSIDGTTITTTTDASGNYTLSNLAAGIYDISYEKPSGGLTKQQQIVCPGTGKLFNGSSIYDKPTFAINYASLKDTTISGTHYQKLYITLTPDTKKRNIIVVYGKTSAIDLADPSSYLHILGLTVNNTSYSANLSYSNPQTNNFPSGSTMYAKIYPSSGLSSGYYDYVINKEVYTAYGTPFPNTFSIVMP